MIHNIQKDKRNEAAQFFIKMNKIIYYMGMPDISIEDIGASILIKKLHDIYKVSTDILSVLLILGEFGAIFAQKGLTDRQRTNNEVFTLGHTFFYTFFFNVSYRQDEIRILCYELLVELKKTYYDEDIGRAMIKKVKNDNVWFIFVFLAAVISYGVEGLIQVIWKDGTFTTVLNVWPDVRDNSKQANIFRVFSFIIYLILMLKTISAYITVIPVMICLSYQYKNLQSYFMSLANIFEEELSQDEKESKYETAFKAGVIEHDRTRWCRKKCQSTFNIIFTSQVILNVSVITMMMMQMVNSERTLFGVFTTLFGMFSVLFSTGFIMANAGNVTVEALEVTTAIYSSGWENCIYSSVRVRQLVTFSMTQAQQEEILWVFKVVPLSYESFVNIVKSSYTIFSVIY